MSRRARLTAAGVGILALGLTSAFLIYFTAGEEPPNPIGYEQGYGSPYAVRPEDSRKYQRDLELYGGKANVIADDFRRWFEGLWRGKSLGVTVGVIAALASGVFFFAAGRSPEDPQTGIAQKK